jgi:hypothetical protein
MISRILRHFKLFEAFGLLLILCAWGLSWNSVERWSTARSEVDSAVELNLRSYTGSQITANVRLEAAVTRTSMRNLEREESDPKTNYEMAWESSEVKQYWSYRLQNELFSLSFLRESMGELDKKYDLGLEGELREIRARINSAESRLKLPEIGKRSAPAAIEIPAHISITEANDIETSLSSIYLEELRLVDRARHCMEKRRSASLNLYRFLFFLGTVVVVASKIADWRKSTAESEVKPI